MTYKGSTPMPDMTLDNKWFAIPVASLNEEIQKTLKDTWKESSKYVMITSELNRVTIYLNRGNRSVLLYFEV